MVERSGIREAACPVACGTTYFSKPKSGPRRLTSASGLREFLQRADGFTGFGTSGVIRAHIGATNHALLINDVSCGHGQAEGVFAVELIQFVSELQINRLEVIGKHEDEAKLTRYLQPVVRQYIKTQIETTVDRAPVPPNCGESATRLAPSCCISGKAV